MRATVRSLAARAKLSVRQCIERLRSAGVDVAVGAQRLDGSALAQAHAILGLAQQDNAAKAATSATLDETELLIRLLRPLREKGKLGRNKTSAFELVYGHGVPDHQKAEAKAFADRLLREGCLDEKVSQGRRHVWLTELGLRRLREAEVAAAG